MFDNLYPRWFSLQSSPLIAKYMWKIYFLNSHLATPHPHLLFHLIYHIIDDKDAVNSISLWLYVIKPRKILLPMMD